MSKALILERLLDHRCNGVITVLAYHRILCERDIVHTHSSPGIVVGRESFIRQLRFLSDSFTLITLDEFLSIAANRMPCPSRAVLITFDDGWEDTYRVAFPIMARMSIPATIFAATGFIGTDKTFWQEEISQLADNLCQDEFNWREGLPSPELFQEWRQMKHGQRKREIRKYVTALKREDYSTIDRVLATFRQCVQEQGSATEIRDRFMTWSQVREMSAAGFEFGSHTTSHRMLDRLPVSAICEEFLASRSALQSATGKPPRALAYPNGNYNTTVTRCAADAGFELAFSMDSGAFNPADRNLYRITRTNIHDGKASSDPLFGATLARLI